MFSVFFRVSFWPFSDSLVFSLVYSGSLLGLFSFSSDILSFGILSSGVFSGILTEVLPTLPSLASFVHIVRLVNNVYASLCWSHVHGGSSAVVSNSSLRTGNALHSASPGWPCVRGCSVSPTGQCRYAVADSCDLCSPRSHHIQRKFAHYAPSENRLPLLLQPSFCGMHWRIFQNLPIEISG